MPRSVAMETLKAITQPESTLNRLLLLDAVAAVAARAQTAPVKLILTEICVSPNATGIPGFPQQPAKPSGLTNSGEAVILYHWSGASDAATKPPKTSPPPGPTLRHQPAHTP